jgi:hypothetical protein
MQPNIVEATMLTATAADRADEHLARLIGRSAIPPTAMMAPVRMKNGIASSEEPAHAAGDLEHDRTRAGCPCRAPRMEAIPSA